MKSTAARSNSTESTALSANSWFNNQLGRTTDGSLVAPRNFLIRNQFGARVGAPIRRNRTFVFFLYEAQRQKTKTAVNTTVFTGCRAEGRFSLLPECPQRQRHGRRSHGGSQRESGHAGRRLGPVANRQSLRAGSQPARLPTRRDRWPRRSNDYPLPNNFQRGDGLNTAGFYWQEPGTNNNNLYNLRLDHILTQSTRLAFSMQLERADHSTGIAARSFRTSRRTSDAAERISIPCPPPPRSVPIC